MKTFIVVIIMLLSFGVANVLAQCPSDSMPGTQGYTNPWNGTYTSDIPVTIGGVTCTWRITYCWRTVGLVAQWVEVYITGITILTVPCMQSPISDAARKKLAGRIIIENNPGNFEWPCPPCSQEIFAYYRIYYASCKEGEIVCDNSNAVCVNEYQVCCDEEGHRILTGPTDYSLGSCPTNCTQSCP